MDPQVCFKAWQMAVLAEDVGEARDTYNDLRVWLERGGFEPSWSPAERKQFFQFSPRTGRIE